MMAKLAQQSQDTKNQDAQSKKPRLRRLAFPRDMTHDFQHSLFRIYFNFESISKLSTSTVGFSGFEYRDFDVEYRTSRLSTPTFPDFFSLNIKINKAVTHAHSLSSRVPEFSF